MKTVDTFANRLKQIRTERDLTLAQLENITGIAAQTLSRYELGQHVPKIDLIPKLSISLNVDPLWLMGYDVPLKNESPSDRIDEGERQLYQLFRLIPKDSQKLVLGMIKSALNEAGLLK